LERDNAAAFTEIFRLGHKLADGLRGLFNHYAVPLILQGFPGAWTISYSESGKIINHADSLAQGDAWTRGLLFSKLMNARNVMVQARFCTSTAHTDLEVEQTLERAESALKDERHGILCS
jgi:glutamate-1-semialdehyde aminotransferase